ncbi:YitT family protein [uncultured Cytophaga sp.]|uniref:YitT family protein n=1 Tax=uncultured Cytophaga sp. TaxID=160238 RepID=UPI00260378DF|nr:YitT family protein [uncultured Cytophaga sp.]
MNKLLTRIIEKSVLRRKYASKEFYSSFEIAKGLRLLKIDLSRTIKDIVLISLGIACAVIGLKSFLFPAQFIDGGATGIALLLTKLTKLDLSSLLIIVNFPFIILGYNVIGKSFAIKTGIAIGVLALATHVFTLPEMTHDKLLVSIFGGFFLGAGIGFSVRGGAVIDGTEVLAIYLSRKFGITMGDVIITFNVLIFSVAAYTLSIETALYSMITYLAASKTIDFVVEGIDEYIGITIISPHSEEMREMITNSMSKGVTVYKGKRGFGKHGHVGDLDIIYTIITRLEISRINTEIEKIDPNAFVIMTSVKDTKGGMVKKRRLKH